MSLDNTLVVLLLFVCRLFLSVLNIRLIYLISSHLAILLVGICYCNYRPIFYVITKQQALVPGISDKLGE